MIDETKDARETAGVERCHYSQVQDALTDGDRHRAERLMANDISRETFEPGDLVQVFNPGPGAHGVVLRHADPEHPMESADRVLVRWNPSKWHQGDEEGWPLNRLLKKVGRAPR